MKTQINNADRRAFLKGSLMASGVLCTSAQIAFGATVNKADSSTKPVPNNPIAGPIKINWIKIIQDGAEPKRVYYHGQTSAGTLVYHYFNLTAANADQVGKLAANYAAAADTYNILYTPDTTSSDYNFITSDKSAISTNPVPKLPPSIANTHNPVKDITTT